MSGAKTATPLHDDDGNVTDYKTLKYSWNAENQMIAAEPKNPSDGDRKTEYLYDYMGRRARKQIYVYSSGAWTLSSEKLFVYDGWNLIKEITKAGASSSDKFYVWGLDLSQSLQGAGGIGGLVCAVSAGEVRHYFYDANGNVGQVVNETGSIVARYEYDPFGNIVNGVSPTDDNPFRFSTKYYDAETGLYYYGFRDYSAELGRWWSRDPLGEEGGLNLYVFVANIPNNKADRLGLELFYDEYGNYDPLGSCEGGIGYCPQTPVSVKDYLDRTLQDTKTALSSFVDSAFSTIERYYETVADEVTKQLHELAMEGRARGGINFQKRYKKDLILKKLEVSWGYFGQSSQKYDYDDCYVSVEVGGYLGFKASTPNPIPHLLYSKPVLQLNGTIVAGYRWKFGEPDQPDRRNLTGKIVGAGSLGLRWETPDFLLTVFKSKAYAEAGFFGSYSYDFVQHQAKKGGGFYAVGVLDVTRKGEPTTINKIDRYQRRYTWSLMGQGEMIVD